MQIEILTSAFLLQLIVLEPLCAFPRNTLIQLLGVYRSAASVYGDKSGQRQSKPSSWAQLEMLNVPASPFVMLLLFFERKCYVIILAYIFCYSIFI